MFDNLVAKIHNFPINGIALIDWHRDHIEYRVFITLFALVVFFIYAFFPILVTLLVMMLMYPDKITNYTCALNGMINSFMGIHLNYFLKTDVFGRMGESAMAVYYENFIDDKMDNLFRFDVKSNK